MSVTLRKETNLYDTDAVQNGIDTGAASAASAAVSAYDTSLKQTAIFNKLTNNGTAQGIFLQNGQLYINMTYLQTGTLKLGGANNGNGTLEVYNASGVQIGKWDKDGINVKSGTIQGANIKAGGQNNGNGIIEVYSNSGERTFILNKDYIRVENSTNNFTYLSYPDDLSLYLRDGSGSSVKQTRILPATIRCSYQNASFTIDVTRTSIYEDLLKIYSSDGSSLLGIGAYLSGVGSDFAVSGDLSVNGSLRVYGTKPRLVKTSDYGERYLYCYETPSPLFGDVGEGTIASDGKCYVQIDSVFAETVSLNQYQVFLQKYGDGDCWVSERHATYFIVEGTPNLTFGWELKAKQADFDQYRLEQNGFTDMRIWNGIDYATEFGNHIQDIQNEREVV